MLLLLPRAAARDAARASGGPRLRLRCMHARAPRCAAEWRTASGAGCAPLFARALPGPSWWPPAGCGHGGGPRRAVLLCTRSPQVWLHACWAHARAVRVRFVCCDGRRRRPPPPNLRADGHDAAAGAAPRLLPALAPRLPLLRSFRSLCLSIAAAAARAPACTSTCSQCGGRHAAGGSEPGFLPALVDGATQVLLLRCACAERCSPCWREEEDSGAPAPLRSSRAPPRTAPSVVVWRVHRRRLLPCGAPIARIVHPLRRWRRAAWSPPRVVRTRVCTAALLTQPWLLSLHSHARSSACRTRARRRTGCHGHRERGRRIRLPAAVGCRAADSDSHLLATACRPAAARRGSEPRLARDSGTAGAVAAAGPVAR